MNTLYDSIGRTYDTTRRADPEIARRIRHHLQVEDTTSVLDVACGTGNYTMALTETGLRMSGVDISEEMIGQARSKSDLIQWTVADVTQLPYRDGTSHGATCILAIHHFRDLEKPFQEVYRVLDSGRFVIFTASPEQMRRYWLNEYFPQAMEASSRQMPSIEDVLHNLRQAGFSVVGTEPFLVQPALQDFFLYSGKHHPAMYLEPVVRAGISTFANLATQAETEQGCHRIRSDIESGKIAEVIDRYASDLGDYLYVIAEKSEA